MSDNTANPRIAALFAAKDKRERVIRRFFEQSLESDDDYKLLGYLTDPDTVVEVKMILERDPNLTDEVRQALGELFTVAYKRFTEDVGML